MFFEKVSLRNGSTQFFIFLSFVAVIEGPQGMLRAAVLYGGMMYVIHGGMLSKRDPSRYVEEPIDF